MIDLGSPTCNYAPQMYAQGTKERFNRKTTLGRIFRECPRHWADMGAGYVLDHSKNCHAILGVILSASCNEQVNYLCAIYEEMFADDDFRTACYAIVQRQQLLKFIDWKSDEHRERVVLVYLGVREARRSWIKDHQ